MKTCKFDRRHRVHRLGSSVWCTRGLVIPKRKDVLDVGLDSRDEGYP